MHGRRWTVIAGAGLLGMLAAAAVATGSASQNAQSGSVRELFLKNCATCHGETGDGKGPTVLERPARSFKDGGFSYGNTPEALLRTITFGIPGSLMPSFKDALNEAQRKSLASYVLGLGPPVLDVKPQDTVMVVRERAVVARGKLPPIGEGAPERPRGLLIGLPSGLTFEYRTDDVRLLGVRSGEFADRTDWIGRGGTVLQPLGRIVRVASSADAPFVHARKSVHDVEDLACRLVATTVTGPSAEIAYDLVGGDGQAVARVRETPSAIDTPLGPGWKRAFAIDKPRSKLVVARLIPAHTPCMRLDERSIWACVPAVAGTGADLTVTRALAGATLSDPSTADQSGIVVATAEEPAAWIVFEIPGAKLPEDAAARRKAIEACARELK